MLILYFFDFVNQLKNSLLKRKNSFEILYLKSSWIRGRDLKLETEKNVVAHYLFISKQLNDI